jgi:hypothetical protein
VIAARKRQTPITVQRSLKPPGRLPVSGETGALEGAAGAFFSDLRLMGLNTWLRKSVQCDEEKGFLLHT